MNWFPFLHPKFNYKYYKRVKILKYIIEILKYMVKILKYIIEILKYMIKILKYMVKILNYIIEILKYMRIRLEYVIFVSYNVYYKSFINNFSYKLSKKSNFHSINFKFSNFFINLLKYSVRNRTVYFFDIQYHLICKLNQGMHVTYCIVLEDYALICHIHR